MKEIELKAGKRTRVLRTVSGSLAMRYRFQATPTNKDDTLSGTIEIRGSNWIFPRKPTTQKLAAKNMINKRAWDSFYSIFVIADCDVKITFQRSKLNFKNLLYPALFAILMVMIAMIWTLKTRGL
ncbi:MAG: hypothetical protein V3V04_01125 [Rhizobiaceae bacterium]